ncbi:MAG: cupin domain-containing protein [bacterium]|nr:cupin domain-containing protein [bacterium]MDI1337714.1 cupin domain-containing protein [Lacunisphaera sp.]
MTPPAKLPSSLFDFAKIPGTPTPVGEVRPYFDAATSTLARLETHLTTLNPGEISHAAHKHADEEMIVIKEGTVEATINGVAHQAGPGSILFFASMDLHGLRNPGQVRASYHVIRIFPRDLPIS